MTDDKIDVEIINVYSNKYIFHTILFAGLNVLELRGKSIIRSLADTLPSNTLTTGFSVKSFQKFYKLPP